MKTTDSEQELRETLKLLYRQKEKLTELFSVISHELRTPASIISLLLDEMDASNDWETVGPKIRSVTLQLLCVLSDMRQAVRPEQNLPVTLEIVDPQVKLERLRSQFLHLAENSGMTIMVEPHQGKQVPLMTDRTRITQCMSNLIKNAIIHSKGSKIALSYREETSADGGVVGIWGVADDGRGIPPEDRDLIFQPFTRTRCSTEKVDGSGLGLFIVKSAAELLGGQVIYLPRSGGGTQFEVHVPMHVVADVNPRETEGTDSQADTCSDPSASLRVLIAEDNAIISDLMKVGLSRVFKTVTIAVNGRDALDIMSADPHDVVLTDLFMPELGGDGLTKKLRSQGFLGPIIGMTAADFGEERRAFEEAGTDHVLTKPVRTKSFVALLNQKIAS